MTGKGRPVSRFPSSGWMLGAAVFLAAGWPVSAPAEEKQTRAVEYLLKHQKPDGTWDIGMQVNPDSGGGVTVATTALASMALLDSWDVDKDRIRLAVDKALKACLEKVWRKEGSVKDFESINWGQLYTLELLAALREHPAWKARDEEFQRQAEELLPWFYGRQRGGGWGYSSSFQTAAALVMLDRLGKTGIKVDPEKGKKGLDFLKSLKGPDVWFYSQGASGRAEKPQETTGRIAVCELACFRLSEAGDRQTTLTRAMEEFMKNRAFLWDVRALTKKGEWPRVLGSASHYAYFPFFGFHYAARAVRETPAKQRKAWAALLRADLMGVRESDGTWVNLPVATTASPAQKDAGYADNVEPGSKIYATAMALMALKHLEFAERDKAP